MFTCMSRPAPQKDIYAELEETIAERRRIMEQMEVISRKGRVVDIFLALRKSA
jgi:hypothetical protein